MRRILGSIAVAALSLAVQAAELPYNESANAAADLQRALAAARADRKLVSGLP
jgi:hypothetical protein